MPLSGVGIGVTDESWSDTERELLKELLCTSDDSSCELIGILEDSCSDDCVIVLKILLDENPILDISDSELVVSSDDSLFEEGALLIDAEDSMLDSLEESCEWKPFDVPQLCKKKNTANNTIAGRIDCLIGAYSGVVL